MSNGTYEDFRDALRAFESGWDRDRYEAGIIQDWQLDQWAGGPVTDFYPGYSSWSDLTAAEWDAMSYRSMNSLGFVGYQFGEALLIDLGYYDDDQFYGNGAATNTWDGTWTGKNGATSLEAFMTAEVQEQAIQDAFGYNMSVIQEGLAQNGQSLDDFIGTTRTYIQDGQEVTVELTMTGILAAAHLRGAWGTLALLQSGSVSTDEYGTSILRYIDQFGGYDSPDADAIIAIWENGQTGDEGLGTPGGDTGGGNSGGDTGGDTGGDSGGDTGDTGGDTGGNTGGGSAPAGNGTANVTKDTADVVITWSWGQTREVAFDPASDTVFVDWVGADALEVTETAQGVHLAIPSNNQSTTLLGVTLAELSAANFTILDATAATEILGLIGSDGDSGSGDGDSGGDTGDGHGDGDGHGGGDGDGDGHGHGDGHGDGHGGQTGQMYMIDANTPAGVIDGFDPATDMIHIEAGVTAEGFDIFEESGDALGQTVRIALTEAGETRQIVFTGIGLDDLTLANFSVADQGVLNEVTAAIGAVITEPGTPGGGYELSYDTDGSNPAGTTGATDQGGVKWRADTNADDIVGFDPATDQIDVGGTSVHGMIITKSQTGEIVIDSPWSNAAQIVQGVTFQDISVDNFAIVGNEHFRQDLGGVLSWELGVGPRESDTVYVRSHEYGVAEVVDNFDPASMNLSFLYFGTRERLSVEDTDAGLVISSLPTGQSLTLTGVQLSDLVPGRLEFHHDQVVEDNLEVPFGFTAEQVTLVDRTMLLTPEAPAGDTTDGFQTRPGDFSTGGGDSGGDTGGDTGGGDTGGDSGGDTGGDTGGGSDPSTVELTWNWGAQTVVSDFDASTDVIDFNALSDGQVAVRETADALVFEVLNNGGHTVTLSDVQAEDLTRANLTADGWNGIDDDGSDLLAQLSALGMDIG